MLQNDASGDHQAMTNVVAFLDNQNPGKNYIYVALFQHSYLYVVYVHRLCNSYRIAGYFHVDLIFEWLVRVEN